MLHGSGTWGTNTTALQRLHRNNCAIICRVCGTKDRYEISSASLLKKTWNWGYYSSPLQSADQILWTCTGATSCIKSITDLPIPGTRGLERPRKTWPECVKSGVSNCGLAVATCKTEKHGELGFDIAWCWQHPNIKMKWMDGWMDGWMYAFQIYVYIYIYIYTVRCWFQRNWTETGFFYKICLKTLDATSDQVCSVLTMLTLTLVTGVIINTLEKFSIFLDDGHQALVGTCSYQAGSFSNIW